MKRASTAGFTLVELLVVIAIIGVLVAMAIPALQASREIGRRAICQVHLGQIMLAVQSYENAFETFPAGVVNPDGPIRNEPVGLHQGWIIQMLPHLDEMAAYRLIDLSQSVYAPVNAPVRELSLPVLICPSEPVDVRSTSNYAGCHHDVEAPIAVDNRGALHLDSYLRRQDFSDGLSHTLFTGEKLIDPGDLGWMSGTRATLRNTGLAPNATLTLNAALAPAVGSADAADRESPATDSDGSTTLQGGLLHVGGFASAHVGGLFVGFGNASVRFIADDIDLTLWQRLANRSDGNLVNLHTETE